MRINRSGLLLTGLVALMVMLGGVVLVSAQDTQMMACSPAPDDTVEISTAFLYIEYNASDGDLGVHGAFDDHGWSELCVYDPNGTLVLIVNPQSQLGDLGMAGIFFESREPLVEEFDFPDLEANFPEGEYTIVGTNVDGTGLTGFATFTHNTPSEPNITAPLLTEDEETASDAIVSTDNLVIAWDAVTESVMGEPVTITSYEVIITKVEHDDPNGYSRPVFDVHLPPDRNSLSVPIEFLEAGTLYELEVLAIEASGNQTISVGFFTTE